MQVLVFPICTFLTARFLDGAGNQRLHSDEEDDVVGHHDLVVVLHAAQGAADLRLREAALAALVDVVHQGGHLH